MLGSGGDHKKNKMRGIWSNYQINSIGFDLKYIGSVVVVLEAG